MKILWAGILVSFAFYHGCASRTEMDNNNRGPIMVSTVKPVYPKSALEKGLEGEVWVKMWVDTLGRVTKVFIEKTPDQSLSNAALDAAVRTRFKPAVLDGKPVGVWYVAPFAVTKK